MKTKSNYFRWFCFSIISLLGLIQCGIPMNTSSNNHLITLEQHIQKMEMAINNVDINTVAGLTYSKMVEELGGRSKMVEDSRKSRENLTKEGIKLGETSLGKAFNVIQKSLNYYAWVPFSTILITPQGTMKWDNHLLAVSEDMGRSWTFMNRELMDQNKFYSWFPLGPENYVFPPKKEPYFLEAKVRNPNIKSVQMCSQINSTTSLCDSDAVNFAPTIKSFHLSAILEDGNDDTQVMFSWYGWEAGRKVLIDEVQIRAGDFGSDSTYRLHSFLTRSNNQWPAANYEVVISLPENRSVSVTKKFKVVSG